MGSERGRERERERNSEFTPRPLFFCRRRKKQEKTRQRKTHPEKNKTEKQFPSSLGSLAPLPPLSTNERAGLIFPCPWLSDTLGLESAPLFLHRGSFRFSFCQEASIVHPEPFGIKNETRNELHSLILPPVLFPLFDEIPILSTPAATTTSRLYPLLRPPLPPRRPPPTSASPCLAVPRSRAAPEGGPTSGSGSLSSRRGPRWRKSEVEEEPCRSGGGDKGVKRDRTGPRGPGAAPPPPRSSTSPPAPGPSPTSG